MPYVSIAQADPFDKGSLRLSAAIGFSHTSDSSYTIMGLGVGFYIMDGLEVGLDAEAWVGGEPDIVKLSPQVTYVLPLSARIRPYSGLFYRYMIIDGFDDQSSAGGRGGVYFTTAPNWFLGAGVVYESYLDCKETPYTSCEEVYLETTFSLLF